MSKLFKVHGADCITSNTYFMYLMPVMDANARSFKEGLLKSFALIHKHYPAHTIVAITPNNQTRYATINKYLKSFVEKGMGSSYRVKNLNSGNPLNVYVFNPLVDEGMDNTKFDGEDKGMTHFIAGVGEVSRCCGSLVVEERVFPSFDSFITKADKALSKNTPITGMTWCRSIHDPSPTARKICRLLGITDSAKDITRNIINHLLWYKTLKFLPSNWQLPKGHEEHFYVYPVGKEYNLLAPKSYGAVSLVKGFMCLGFLK